MELSKLRRHYATQIKKTISKINVAIVISLFALLVSGLHLYFQFFHVRNELMYTYLIPQIDHDQHQLIIPVVYKNTGNQNEILLSSNIELEIKPDDGSENYFKRIGDQNISLFPVIVSPGDYKTINLTADYAEYHKGMLEVGNESFHFREIVNYDSLSLVLTTKIMSNNEIADTKRKIGYVYFRPDKEVSRIDFYPVKLIKLKSDNEAEMVRGSVINMNYSGTFSLNEPLSPDQIEQIKFFRNQVNDSLLIKVFDEALRKNR